MLTTSKGVPGWIHISVGGPEFDIQVNGKRYHFEWHPYCGPVVLTKAKGMASVQPVAFLGAASNWNKEGRKVDPKTGLCIWHHASTPITEHIAGRHYRYIGEKPGALGI